MVEEQALSALEGLNFRWSFSSYEAYNTCPRRYYEVRVAKNFQEADSEAMQEGRRIHLALELAVKDGTALPHDLSHLSPIIGLVKKIDADIHTEQKLAVDNQLSPVSFAEGWCVGIADLNLIKKHKAVTLDYKNGKVKITNQLDLLAILVFQNFPEVNEISSGFVWLKERCKITPNTFRRKEVPELVQKFLPTLQKMSISYEEDVWPCKPSGLCRNWCPVRSCQYNGNYERGWSKKSS